MNRRSLLKNCLLGLAISLVPEILRPKEVDIYDGPRLSNITYDEPNMWIVKCYDGREEIGYFEWDEQAKVRFVKVNH